MLFPTCLWLPGAGGPCIPWEAGFFFVKFGILATPIAPNWHHDAAQYFE